MTADDELAHEAAELFTAADPTGGFLPAPAPAPRCGGPGRW